MGDIKPIKQDWRSDGQKEAAKWQAILDSIPIHYQPITPAIFKELMRQRMAMKCKETGLTWAQMMCDSAIARAVVTGDISQVADRVDGKVPQAVAIGGDKDNPLELIIKGAKTELAAKLSRLADQATD